MTHDEFMELTVEEQTAILTDRDNLTEQVNNLTAERNSLLTEREQLTEQVNSLTGEVAKTKEMNYTLTRQLDLHKEGAVDPEELIKQMFMD